MTIFKTLANMLQRLPEFPEATVLHEFRLPLTDGDNALIVRCQNILDRRPRTFEPTWLPGRTGEWFVTRIETKRDSIALWGVPFVTVNDFTVLPVAKA